MRKVQFLLRKAIPFIIILAVIYFLPIGGISDASLITMEGVASWYSERSPGVKDRTANMEKFDHDLMTCAMWGVPFGSIVEVTNLGNGKKIIVRVNDRGPAKRLVEKGRIIDLTMAAFRKIGHLEKGLIRVRLRVVKIPSNS